MRKNVKRHGSVLGFFSLDMYPPVISCCDCGKTIKGDGIDLPPDDECKGRHGNPD